MLTGSSTHLSLPMDVSNTSTISTAMSAIKEKFSRPPNVLVNCAGITRDNWFLKLTEKDFQQVFDVNLKDRFPGDKMQNLNLKVIEVNQIYFIGRIKFCTLLTLPFLSIGRYLRETYKVLEIQISNQKFK
ncbi:uncharacterized protein LOC103517556 [Diaphorina citri]|uniref:Uncharacterized protein LOC103517556 n=1 Tax=Diaphorina citri TaxID=121845 RepID=A0A1S3DH16_DIACI|nr:uncharacterized protein LOC103517556 [Diaphorina citri]